MFLIFLLTFASDLKDFEGFSYRAMKGSEGVVKSKEGTIVFLLSNERLGRVIKSKEGTIVISSDKFICPLIIHKPFKTLKNKKSSESNTIVPSQLLKTLQNFKTKKI